MRVEDFLNQSIHTSSLKSAGKQTEAAVFSTPESRQDTVSISQEARDAQQSGGYFTQKAEAGSSQAKMDFKAYMDKAMGRVPSAPKPPEEKIEELAEKIKQLKSQLSEIMSDQSLSEQVRSSRTESINSQVNALQEQINQIGKEMSESAA